MRKQARTVAKAQSLKDLEDMVDREPIHVVDKSKSYYEPTAKELHWEMSALDALQVNYLTRTNRSVEH